MSYDGTSSGIRWLCGGRPWTLPTPRESFCGAECSGTKECGRTAELPWDAQLLRPVYSQPGKHLGTPALTFEMRSKVRMDERTRRGICDNEEKVVWRSCAYTLLPDKTHPTGMRCLPFWRRGSLVTDLVRLK